MPEYDGPERRKTTLAQLLSMQNTMTDLSREVGRLTGELETVNEISRRQDDAEETSTVNHRRQRRTNILIGIALLLVVATLISVAVLAGIVAVDARASSRSRTARPATLRVRPRVGCSTSSARSRMTTRHGM